MKLTELLRAINISMLLLSAKKLNIFCVPKRRIEFT